MGPATPVAPRVAIIPGQHVAHPRGTQSFPDARVLPALPLDAAAACGRQRIVLAHGNDAQARRPDGATGSIVDSLIRNASGRTRARR